MRKINSYFTLFIILVLTILGFYWFLMQPNTNKNDNGLAKDEVVNSYRGNINEEKLYQFISNVENKEPDKVRVIHYTIEGDPIITDMHFDGRFIDCKVDSTQDHWGSRDIYYGQYTRIVKHDNNGNISYRLVDDNAEYREVVIFYEH